MNWSFVDQTHFHKTLVSQGSIGRMNMLKKGAFMIVREVPQTFQNWKADLCIVADFTYTFKRCMQMLD